MLLPPDRVLLLLLVSVKNYYNKRTEGYSSAYEEITPDAFGLPTFPLFLFYTASGRNCSLACCVGVPLLSPTDGDQ